MANTQIPGYKEVLELFEQYKREWFDVERARDDLASLCLRQTALIKNDKHNENAYYGVSALQKYVENREEFSETLTRQLDKYTKVERDVMWLIDKLGQPHRNVIELRYIYRLDWLHVVHQMAMRAKGLGLYSERSCKRYRNEAFVMLAPHYYDFITRA